MGQPQQGDLGDHFEYLDQDKDRIDISLGHYTVRQEAASGSLLWGHSFTHSHPGFSLFSHLGSNSHFQEAILGPTSETTLPVDAHDLLPSWSHISRGKDRAECIIRRQRWS
jgi:hypothetical protein